MGVLPYGKTPDKQRGIDMSGKRFRIIYTLISVFIFLNITKAYGNQIIEEYDLSLMEPTVFEIPTENIYNDYSEKGVLGGFSYEIESIEISNQIGDRNMDEIHYFLDTEVNEVGELLDGSQYLWVKIIINNITDQTVEHFANTNRFVHINSQNQAYLSAAEAQYISPKQEGNLPNQSFKIKLSAGEKWTGELGYILPPTEEVSDLYYGILTGNADLSLEEHVFYPAIVDEID